MPSAGPNHYHVLGVDADATPAQIRHAFRELVKSAHPDVGGDARTFQRIQDAYDVLRDPARRRDYDDTMGISWIRTASPGTSRTGWAGTKGDFSGDVEFPNWLRDVAEAPWGSGADPDEPGGGESDDLGQGAGAGGAVVAAEVLWWWPRRAVQPPVHAGALLVMSAEQSLVGVSLHDGLDAWEAPLGSPVVTRPVVAGAFVVVATADGQVHGLELGTGVTRWEHRNGEAAHVVELSEPDDPRVPSMVLVAAGDLVTALDPSTGTPHWSVRCAGRVLTLVTHPQLCVVSTDRSGLEAYSLRRGRQQWRLPSVPHPEVPVCVARPGLWLAGRAGALACLDATNAAVLTKVQAGQALAGMAAGLGGPVLSVGGPAAVVQLDAQGQARWQVLLPTVSVGPTVYDGHAYLVGTDGVLRTVELSSGRQLTASSLSFDPRGEPVGAGNAVALLDPGGQVWVLRRIGAAGAH